MYTFIVIVVWLFPALIVHAFYAISLTASQRLAILAAINDPEPLVALDKIDAFSNLFDAHLWRLLTFRDPWRIYPALLSKELRRAGA